MMAPPPKSPGLGVVLSLIWPGAGQFYNGHIGKGFLFLPIALMGLGLFLSGTEEPADDATACAWVLVILFTIASVIDAHESAKRVNHEAALFSRHF